MKHLILFTILALSACRTETVATPDPVPMTAGSIGHFCQMNLLEHPGPKAQIHLNGVIGPLFFSQVRDAIAYQRMPERDYDILAIYVSDMDGADWENPGADNWIDATGAVFVTGSAQQGGMGAAELIPFGTESAARSFIAAHGGDMRRLDDIPTADILAPEPITDDTSPQDDNAGYADRLRQLNQQGGN
ncbi:nitrous oxide reductase accessory protein NosL [Paracoccus sp. (in: a-proteobacteria)]|uniref:nitrous oxide reductase accessory protein NosL n=1 Tax=Paracoccus sp. TaxID=267 RepID=UPI0026E0FDDC|nr:nitrous oxide reductase accessory protein NosL [Paracoccus sp. (in: a-proteobacteria)]MDO5646910.1 nitrous oxide reductase accessory protein NosL [Paracoccus sp. (in: a-proteobacteria)]